MAQKQGGKKIRGVLFRRGTWWCRWFENGRERVEKCDSKTQASIRYGFHRSQVREQKFFPEKFAATKAITLRAWLARVNEGSTNKGSGNERVYGRRWSLYLGGRLLADITTEDLRRIQAKMRAKMKWTGSTINRHFAYIRHCFSLAVKDNKITRNPVSGVTFFPRAKPDTILERGRVNTLAWRDEVGRLAARRVRH